MTAVHPLLLRLSVPQARGQSLAGFAPITARQ